MRLVFFIVKRLINLLPLSLSEIHKLRKNIKST